MRHRATEQFFNGCERRQAANGADLAARSDLMPWATLSRFEELNYDKRYTIQRHTRAIAWGGFSNIGHRIQKAQLCRWSIRPTQWAWCLWLGLHRQHEGHQVPQDRPRRSAHPWKSWAPRRYRRWPADGRWCRHVGANSAWLFRRWMRRPRHRPTRSPITASASSSCHRTTKSRHASKQF